ncbi:MAG: bacillithiol system redox-active protein YtxJ [Thermomicrobiales bacterium]
MARAQRQTPDTGARFVPVADAEALEQLFVASAAGPVILFKHDPYCPVSEYAYQEMQTVPGEIALIDVARQHAISREIATRLGVTHESPQVIVVRGGKPVYDASHEAISEAAVQRAVAITSDGAATEE